MSEFFSVVRQMLYVTAVSLVAFAISGVIGFHFAQGLTLVGVGEQPAALAGCVLMLALTLTISMGIVMTDTFADMIDD